MRKPTPLKRAIFDSGKTQKRVADEVGINESHLSRIVNGLHADEGTRVAIAAALERQVDELWPNAPHAEAA
jgi:transcriptional regulator with XRE-family HTH domain